jgi:hypothetical protein
MYQNRNTSARVMRGPFVGRTRAELLALLRDAQDELGEGGDNITSASINGQQFSAGGGPSVLSRIRLITAALAQVDPDFIAPQSTINVRFGGC